MHHKMSIKIKPYFYVLRRIFLRLVYGCSICVALFFIVLAIGLPGRWIKPFIQRYLPADVGEITFDWIAYRPYHGLILKNFVFTLSETNKPLVRVGKIDVEIELFTDKDLFNRIQKIHLNDFYLAQLPQNHPYDDPRGIYQPHTSFPNLQGYCPTISPIQIIIHNADVLDIQGESLFASFEAKEDKLIFNQLLAKLRPGDEVKGELVINLATTIVDLHLKGYALNTDINGVYRVLNFPLIEKYSNKFTLQHNAWADAKFSFSLDKYRNQFEGIIQLETFAGGAYCDVPFDSGKGVIITRGVWNNHTEIKNIQAFREGKLAASGDLTFNTSMNRFSFKAKNYHLTPKECLKLIDMPFTKVIPEVKIADEKSSSLTIEGYLPFLTPQEPKDVVITSGYFDSFTPCSIYGCNFGTLSGNIQMKDGIVTLDNLSVTDNHGGSASGQIMVKIPPSATYVDAEANFSFNGLHLKIADDNLSLSEILGQDAVVIGETKLSCRMDDTLFSTLNSTFDLNLQGQLLNRFPLFAGLTNLFADYVPGVSFLTDAKKMFLKGRVVNGKVDIPSFQLEGSFFNVEGPITYDLKTEKIDAALIIGFFKKGSIASQLTRWVTAPLMENLWQVHLTGTKDNPIWSSQTIIGQMKDVLLGGSDKYSKMKQESENTKKEKEESSSSQEKNFFNKLFN